MSPTGYVPAANIRHVSRSCAFARALTLCTTSSRLSGFTPAPSRRRRVGFAPGDARCANDHDELLLERAFAERSSLVDPASSHMLVSKIKPCMSQCMPN